MEAEPPKADASIRERRWFQFSLRTLLIVVTMLAIFSGWQAHGVATRPQESLVRLAAVGNIAAAKNYLRTVIAPAVPRFFMAGRYNHEQAVSILDASDDCRGGIGLRRF